MTKPLPSQKILRSLLEYDPHSGSLTWRERDKSNCVNPKWFNARFANKPAFIAVEENGYNVGLIHGVHYKAHRVIWRWMTGDDPSPLQVDHINRDRTDNRWCNLRRATRSQNQANKRRARRQSSSAYKGVSYLPRTDSWQGYIRVNGKKLHLGTFKCEAAAARAYDQAAIKHFGAFALTNSEISGGAAQ